MRPNIEFRRDLLLFISKRGDVTAKDIKTLAEKHGFTDQHIRITLQKLKKEGLIKRGTFLTDAGKKYLKGDAE